MAIEHIVVHKGPDYHCAFPETIRLQNGDLVTSFRESPVVSEDNGGFPPGDEAEGPAHHHRHPESRAALVRSADDGLTWDPATRVVINASDGTRDLNLGMISQVSSGELLFNDMHLLVNVTEDRAAELGTDRRLHVPRDRAFGAMVFDDLYLARSSDNGHTWGKLESFAVSSLAYYTHTGQTSVVDLLDGTWLLPLNGHCAPGEPDRVYVARSTDGGRTWGRPSTVAYDPERQRAFHEPPMIRLSSGKLLIVMRTHAYPDRDGSEYLYQAFSTDGGWVWQGLKRTPFWGYPSHLLELRSGRVLCTYGYRREPFGVRAAISEDEGETWDADNEIVIRDDGPHRDLGYPAAVQLNDGRVLVTYYFPDTDGIRYIAGSILTLDGE